MAACGSKAPIPYLVREKGLQSCHIESIKYILITKLITHIDCKSRDESIKRN